MRRIKADPLKILPAPSALACGLEGIRTSPFGIGVICGIPATIEADNVGSDARFLIALPELPHCLAVLACSSGDVNEWVKSQSLKLARSFAEALTSFGVRMHLLTRKSFRNESMAWLRYETPTLSIHRSPRILACAASGPVAPSSALI